MQLAINGGKPIRTTEFRSKPYITEEMVENVSSLLSAGTLTGFVGSPSAGTKEILGLKSSDMAKITSLVTFLGGPCVRKLESKWSECHNVDYSIAVNSATSGLITAFMALGIGAGDEVICSPFSFTASATSIILANAVPIFADIDLDTFCLSPNSALDIFTDSTKAIMPIHWNSNAGDLGLLLSEAKYYGFKVIEDASQSPLMLYGRKYLGTHGDAGVFSLNQPKNIMTGEGGVIVTNNKDVAVKCRLIRNHGESVPDENSTDDFVDNAIGYNFRLVELLAEIGSIQLKSLRMLNNIRKRNYAYLIDQLSEFREFLIPQKITHLESYYPYTAGFRWLSEESGIHRDLIARVLRAEGIPVASGISRLMSDNPLFQRQLACAFFCHRGNYSIPELPNAKKLQNEQYLGFFQVGWPNTIRDMDDIVAGFKKIFDNKELLERMG